MGNTEKRRLIFLIFVLSHSFPSFFVLILLWIELRVTSFGSYILMFIREWHALQW